MKRYLDTAAKGALFALGFIAVLSLQSAFGWVIHGRNSEGANDIVQTGIPATSVEQGITATPSGTQLNAYQLTAGVNQVTTVATIGDAVRLPSVSALYSPTSLDGSLAIVTANHTGNSMNMFPFEATTVIVSGGTALGAGAALAIPANKVASCYSVSTGRWYCQVA